MKHFTLLASGVDVSGVNAELEANPELWGANKYRVSGPDSPHHGVPDIWLRWRPASELTSAAAYREPHFSTFWPAWSLLPSLHPIVRNLSHVVDAVQLGGILITRINPGESVKPHIDGGWHAQHYDFKAYVCLRGNPFSINWVEDEPFSPREGDCFEFSNKKLHWVTNDGPTPRMTAIICFRTAAHDLAQARRSADPD
jgi:hypothetical protein